MVIAVAALLPVVSVTPAQALPDGLTLTPPMRFNNWNTTGCAVDEQIIRDTADIFVAQDGLIYITDYDAGLYILQWKGA